MTVRTTLSVLLASAALGTGGCSDDVKKAEPRLAPGVAPDPRLKPDRADGTPTQQKAARGD